MKGKAVGARTTLTAAEKLSDWARDFRTAMHNLALGLMLKLTAQSPCGWFLFTCL